MVDEFHRKLRSYSLFGIFVVIFLILVVLAFAVFNRGGNDLPSTNTGGEGSNSGQGAGTPISNSVCTTDSDCISQYGSDYKCVVGTCYFSASSNNTKKSGLLGFFENFFTGNVVGSNPGDAIYYNDGWVGIGTDTPQAGLDVDGKIKIGDDNVNDWVAGMIRWTGSAFQGYNGTTWIDFGNYSSGGSVVSPWTESGGGVYYTGGSVGVGTNSPQEALHISGGFPQLRLDGNGETPGLEFYSGSSFYSALSSGSSSALSLKNSAGNFIFNALQNGNIGIGTTNPSELLDVAGNIKASGTICDSTGCIGGGSSGGTSLWSSSGSDIYYNSGKVGIGITSPLKRLQIEAPTDSLFGIRSTGTSGTSINAGIEIKATDPSASSFIDFGTGASSINNPDYQTRISQVSSDRLGIFTTGGNERFTVTQAGNIGIGTSSPSEKLDVAGNIKASGTASIGGSLLSSPKVYSAACDDGEKYRDGSDPQTVETWCGNTPQSDLTSTNCVPVLTKFTQYLDSDPDTVVEIGCYIYAGRLYIRAVTKGVDAESIGQGSVCAAVCGIPRISIS